MLLGIVTLCIEGLVQLVKSTHIPPPIIGRAAKVAIKQTSIWYSSLSGEDRDKVDKAILFVVKDLTKDLIKLYTGMDFEPLVDMVIDILGKYQANAEAKSYIKSQIKMKCNIFTGGSTIFPKNGRFRFPDL
ncbi:MAG: hypothetical protein M0P01_00630 [Treponema sp.]|nr:hypothetical protein [Treponema sp.]